MDRPRVSGTTNRAPASSNTDVRTAECPRHVRGMADGLLADVIEPAPSMHGGHGAASVLDERAYWTVYVYTRPALPVFFVGLGLAPLTVWPRRPGILVLTARC